VQWQQSVNGTTWTNITGATASVLSFTATIADNNKQYRAVWTNTVGTANSIAATLTVNAIPTLSGALTATVTSGNLFTYIPASGTPGTTFAWSRAAVSGISNLAASGTGAINETLFNTLSAPVNVTYVFTLTANGCTNTQNVVVSVGSATSTSSPTIESFTTKTGKAATVHSLTGVPADALLVLATTSEGAMSNCVVSSSPALTWTKRVDAGAASSDNAEIWTAAYPAGGSITVTSNWGNTSQSSVCYVVLNADPAVGGAFGTAVSQSAPSVTVTTTRDNSIIVGCTADWKGTNGANRILRDAATDRLYFKDGGHYTTYHYTKAATAIAAYTEGVSAPTGQQASTAVSVTNVTPANGITGVLVNSTASAVFSEAMNAATINNSTIEWRNSSNILIPASVSYNAITGTATVTPSSSLSNSTAYTITIKGGASGLKDAAGNALANDYSWSFTTETGDITPPTVTAVSPLNGSTGINTDANIVASFSEALNVSSVTATSFQLRDAGNNLVPASLSTSSGQITLDPASALSASTVYTATITGGAAGVKDLSGNPIAANYTWSFTTAQRILNPSRYKV
jgi:hypothetical protein